MKHRPVMMVSCLAAALWTGEASAQLFCLSTNCGTSLPPTYFPHVLDAPTGGMLGSTIWMRGFVSGLMPVAVGGASTAMTQPAPPMFAMLLAPLYNEFILDSDELSPLVVGQASGIPVAVVTNHAARIVRAVSGYGASAQGNFSGYWSDPAIACASTRCVAAVSNTDNGIALVVFNGATVVTRSFSVGDSSGMSSVGLTNRPAIVTAGSDRFILVARSSSAARVPELSFVEINTSTEPATISPRTVYPLSATLTPGTPIVASSTGGSMLVAFSTTTGPAMIQSINVIAAAVAPSLGAISLPAPVVRRLGRMRTFDLARNATTYVLSWQEPSLFRMPIASVLVAPNTYDVAYRAPVPADLVAGTSLVRAHRMASGPKPLLVYEETAASAGATTPRALGYVLDVCREASDCELTLGAGWTGTCNGGVCRPVVNMDAGVADASTADATVDANAGDTATVRDSGVLTDGPMDSATGRDAIAVEDVGVMDAADARAMDSAVVDSAAMDSAMDGASVVDAGSAVDGASATDAPSPTGVPVITGGACGCRAAGSGRSALGACAIVLALCVVGARRRRATFR